MYHLLKTHKNILLALILRTEFKKNGIEFFTPNHFSLNVSQRNGRFSSCFECFGEEKRYTVVSVIHLKINAFYRSILKNPQQ